jgi:hypothetical protein
MSAERDFSTADLANAGEPAQATADEQRLQEAPPARRPVADASDAGPTAVDQPAEASGSASDAASAPLFPSGEGDRFRQQWVEVQGQFVDEPRQAVEQADHLVAELMQRLATQFSETRSELERRWDGQENVSTEELRIAMTQYRSFFERLLQA